MKRLCNCTPKCRLMKIMNWLQVVLGMFVIIVSISSLYRFYSAGFFMRNEEICKHLYTYTDKNDINSTKNDNPHPGFDIKALTDRITEVLEKMDTLQDKLESTVNQIEKKTRTTTITASEHKKYLEEQVIKPLYEAQVALRQLRIPNLINSTVVEQEEPLINTFVTEEIKKYITPKPTRPGYPKLSNPYGTERVFNTIAHSCVLRKKDLERYMDYEIGSYCDDDWVLGQTLMLNGCDPLPRRRCLTRASKTYQRPYPINESLWKIPDDRNVRWSNYQCRSFKCLSGQNPKRGFSNCQECFDMDKEKLKWVKKTNSSSSSVDFSVEDVLTLKPGEIRVGLDFGLGTGSFAARMREKDVTIVTAAMNLGAPFNEIIALRGLVPLHVTLSQRLPFFDNTMDVIHMGGFLHGWVDLTLMDFVLFDWDRVLRPGGLLWVDRFFCNRSDIDDFMYMFLQFRYKKHKWVVAPKSKDEIYFSALLEKPPRAI